jgi:cytochrome c oxidase subunit 2
METTKTFWLPEKASTFAEIVDPAFNLFYWISVFFFVLICGLIVVFTFKYLRRRPDQLASAQIVHNTTIEAAWTLIPLGLVMMLFVVGMRGYLDMRVSPTDAMTVNVLGQKWSWTFTYPEGAVNDTLVVPLGKPVKLVMTSTDVLHSFFIPAFRTKADVIPGRYNSLWFEATKTGVFPVECTQYCGTRHSYMLTAVKVLEPEAYATWIKAAANPAAGLTPAEFGAIVYKKRGCNACHTLDGVRGIGPSWKGIFNQTHKFADGSSALVDEEYIRRSIIEPASQVVESFAPVMPTYKGVLSDDEIAAVVAFIQTLK